MYSGVVLCIVTCSCVLILGTNRNREGVDKLQGMPEVEGSILGTSHRPTVKADV